MGKGYKVEITGLKENQRALRRAKNTAADAALKHANKEVSDLVASATKPKIKSKSGDLARDTRSAPTKRHAQVRLGRRGQRTAKYAGPNVFGWPGRFKGSLAPQKAIKERWKRIRKSYESNMSKAMDIVRKGR